MVTLTFTIDGEDRTENLADGSHIVGRSKACDIVIKHGSVSKQHLRIDVKGDRVSVRDLLSSNGTFLNGEKVQEGSIRPGDRLRLGKVDVSVASDAMPVSGDDGATQDIPPVAPAAPPAGFVLPDNNAPEETPPDGNFVPAVVVPDSQPRAAVQVVRPGEGGGDNLPVPVPAGGDAGGMAPDAKKKILIAVGTALFVIAVAILMLPSPDGKTGGGQTKLNYWGSVEEGEALFKNGQYAEARKVWQDIHDKWQKANKDSNLRVANVFANVARAFEMGLEGRFAAIRWLPLRADVGEVVEFDVIPTDRQKFAHEMLMRIRDEMDAQELYQEAERLREAGEYEEAIAKYVAIPQQSVYHSVVAERRQACLDAEFNQYRQAAMEAGANRNWPTAIENAEEALKQRDDARLTAELKNWRENDRVEKLVKRFKNQLNGDRLDEAQATLQELRSVDENHYAVAGLAALEDQLEKKLYMRKLDMLYATWNEPGLEEAEGEPGGNQADAQRIFIKVKNLQRLRDEAEAELKKDEPESGFRARDKWQAILEIEDDRQHPMNLFARNRLKDNSLSALGAALKKKAQDAVREEDYKRARDLLQMAQSRCKVDVSEEVDVIQEKGRKLYNEGNSLWNARSPRRYEAALKWKKARDCFLPNEPWYKIVDDQIRRKLGEGE